MRCIENKKIIKKKNIYKELNKSVDSFTSDLSIDEPNLIKIKKRQRINKTKVDNDLISSSLYISSIIIELSKNKKTFQKKKINLSLYNSFFLYPDLFEICSMEEQIFKNENLFLSNDLVNHSNELIKNNSFEYKGISMSNDISVERNDKFSEMNQGISRTSLNIIHQNNIKSYNFYNCPSIQFKSEIMKSGINFLNDKDKYIDTSLVDYLNEERSKINENPNFIKEKIRRNSNLNKNNTQKTKFGYSISNNISIEKNNRNINKYYNQSEGNKEKKYSNQNINKTLIFNQNEEIKMLKKNKFKKSKIKIDLRDVLNQKKNINDED